MMKTDNHRSTVALLLMDLVNHFEFPDGSRLLRNALPLVAPLARLKQGARRAGVPIIYVNDNFGQWQSDAGKLLAYCLRVERPAREFVGPLQPDAKDYCVLKPMHSAFYQTPLDVLLRHLNVSSLVLAGLATNSCILCTAHDAKMRDYHVTVLSDGCAARTLKEHNEAIAHIRDMADARIESARSLRFYQCAVASNTGRGPKARKGQGDGR
jgi:nicotinamidase-related amidase